MFYVKYVRVILEESWLPRCELDVANSIRENFTRFRSASLDSSTDILYPMILSWFGIFWKGDIQAAVRTYTAVTG